MKIESLRHLFTEVTDRHSLCLLELLTEPKLQDRDFIWPALLVLTSMSYILSFSLMQRKLICAMRSGLGGQQWTVPILLPPLILLTMNSFPPINANLDVRKCKLLGSKSPEWLITKYLLSLLKPRMDPLCFFVGLKFYFFFLITLLTR